MSIRYYPGYIVVLPITFGVGGEGEPILTNIELGRFPADAQVDRLLDNWQEFRAPVEAFAFATGGEASILTG